MRVRMILLILVYCCACRSGEIPCPEPKAVKARRSHAHKHIRQPDPSLTANAKQQLEESRSYDRLREPREVKSAESIEDWGCPKPGMKKTPKAVKENIRKNKKKIKSYFKHRSEVDSIQTITSSPDLR